jgi:hypothetical protein
MSWSNYEQEKVTRVEEGNYLARVISAEEIKSRQKGTRGIEVYFKINGTEMKVRNTFWDSAYFDSFFNPFRDNFGIEKDNFNFDTWVGAVGGVTLKENENGYMEIAKFINASKVGKEWKGEQPKRQTVGGFTEVAPTDDLPF